MKTRVSVILLATALAAFSARADTFLQYVSQYPGQFAPQSVSVSAPTATISVVKYTSGAIGAFTTWPDGFKNLSLTPPTGQQLAIGAYQGVGAYDPTPTQASMVFDAQICVGSGSFTILDLAYDASQAITRFAVDFAWHCTGSDAGVAGGLRFNSSVPYTPQALAVTPASFQYFSQIGDSVGRGQSASYTNSDGVFSTAAFPAGPNVAEVDFAQEGVANWKMRFSNPGGGALVPGTYTSGVDVSSGIACSINTSSFTVYEIEYGAQGSLTKFAVDFQQNCPGNVAGLYGAIRYNSSVPYAGPPATATAHFIRLIRNSAVVPYGGATSPIEALVVDVNGNGIKDAVVTFNAGACGTFGGPTSVQATTDVYGHTSTPEFVAGYVTMADCQVTLSTPTTQPSPTFPPFDVAIYNPATTRLTANPQSIDTETDSDFTVSFTISSDVANMAGRNISLNLMASGGATPLPYQPGGAAVDTNNQAVLALRANSTAGSYTIVAQVDGVTVQVPVTQSARTNSPPAITPVTQVENMWWVGADENGWGMSLIQHDERLFGALYIYDATGNPTWIIMSGGAWDSTHTIFTGPLYEPTGTPFYAYDTTRFQVGTQVGTVTITFQDSNNATIVYNIGVNSGHKVITREVFGASSITGTDHTDLWWGGNSQNGWGITITQQGSTLFPIWFTYGTSGAPLWYFMTDGTWNAANDTYTGNMYRATGSPWMGATYDPSKLVVTKAGTFSIVFTASGATFNYNADGHSGSTALVREAF